MDRKEIEWESVEWSGQVKHLTPLLVFVCNYQRINLAEDL
jgi:hypothetical protein